MKNLLQNEKQMKMVYFIASLLLFSLGLFMVLETEARFLHKVAFTILAICGAIGVIATFIKDQWKNTRKIVKNSFAYSGFVLIIGVVWDHLVHDVIHVPNWGLVVSYIIVIAMILLGIMKLIEFIKEKRRSENTYS
ncbi:hypothetical protein [Sutcliffiella cohnii]|uniref:hypothetical protein n=1 Tax=Sutcliffiella cohnii TaxID=33932 RepID=UPI002E1A0BE4|nr:hypothetical protein [Sutcliffiella cohnii]